MEATGNKPLTYSSPVNREVILLAGEDFDANRDPGLTNYLPEKVGTETLVVELNTDNWPFLFLEKRGVPFHYLLPLFIIFALAFVLLYKIGLRPIDVNWHLLFMGGAFLLIETKAVTTLALVFGSIWMVNSIVIAAILLMILLSNFVVSSLPSMSYLVLYLGLCASVLFNFGFSFDSLNQPEWQTKALVSGLDIALPLFFAALIFAKAFSAVEPPSNGLASNLLGGLVGGLLEYLDMWAGLRALNLIALTLYVLSAVCLTVKLRSQSTFEP